MIEIPIDTIQPSPMNTFNTYPDDKMAELVASIKNTGLLEPLLVRPASCCETYSISGDYEIISGHNRYLALKNIGEKKARCNVKKMDDISASLAIGQSNIQRGISEIETARIYRKTYDLMKNSRGGDRRSKAYRSAKSGSHDGNMVSEKDRTLQRLAESYGIAPSTMYRKIRLSDLIPEVLDKYNKKKITQSQAVQISFADKDMQLAFMKYYSSTDRNWISDAKANAFGETARKANGHITPNQIREIMESDTDEEEVGDSYQKNKDKKYPVPSVLFPTWVKKKDRPGYVLSALKYVRDNDIRLSAARDA